MFVDLNLSLKNNSPLCTGLTWEGMISAQPKLVTGG